ncbi:MAG: type II secretion system protein GspG [Planctomycetota bacterium]|jgi:hypothetical protein
MTRRESGLVILLVAVAVAGFLLWAAGTRAERVRREVGRELNMLARALVLYQREFGRAASDLSDLVHQNYVGPSSCVDPWEHWYRYSPGSGSAFSLVCLGSDGRPGGRGLASDVTLPAPRLQPGALIPPNAFLLVSALAMIGAVLVPARVITRHRRVVARRRRACCGQCGYPLEGLDSDTCPECGARSS